MADITPESFDLFRAFFAAVAAVYGLVMTFFGKLYFSLRDDVQKNEEEIAELKAALAGQMSRKELQAHIERLYRLNKEGSDRMNEMQSLLIDRVNALSNQVVEVRTMLLKDRKNG